MKLSIVTPAYNVEQYIENCLDSIFCQQIETDQLEVIVINDGSTDGTESIIKKYAALHTNLIYIYQENQGQSVARNNGLKKATGDLIWYVDSDDAITENSIKTIFSYFNKYPNADFLTFDRIHYNLEDGSKNYCKSWGEKHFGVKLKEKNDIYEKPLNGKIANSRLVASVPWFHVYKRKYLINHNLYFTPNLLNEDDELRMRLFFFAKEVRYIPFAHYIYSAMRPGSLTTMNHTFTRKSAESCMGTANAWKTFMNNNSFSLRDEKYILRHIAGQFKELLCMPYEKDEELKKLYVDNRKLWRKEFFINYIKSFSLSNLSFIGIVRFIVTLLFPKYIKYTEFRTLKSLFHL